LVFHLDVAAELLAVVDGDDLEVVEEVDKLLIGAEEALEEASLSQFLTSQVQEGVD